MPSPSTLRRALAAAIAAAALAAVVVLAMSRPGGAERDASPAAAALRTVVAERREVDLTVPAEGVVEAARQSVVAARVPGWIVELRVEAGDAVTKGQVLARIDERAAAQAVTESFARIRQAEADLSNARSHYERTRKLVTEKFVSASALDKARADFDAAEAQLAAARAAAAQATTSKDYAVVTAPFSGLVAVRHAQIGEMAQAGTPLVTLYDPSELRVIASVPQETAAALRTRRAPAFAEFPTINRMVPAKAVIVLPSSDTRTLTTDVRLDLAEPVPGVVPGTFARAHFSVGRATRLVVPAEALVQRSEVSGVYVVTPAGGVQLRQLRLGERTSAGVEVLAGLAPGERVALDPTAALAALKAQSR
jgi:RND family efflux transporter MFP subunit